MGVGHLAVTLNIGVGADVDPMGGDHVFFTFLQVSQVYFAVAVGRDQLGHGGGVATQVVLVHQDLDVVGAGEHFVALGADLVVDKFLESYHVRINLLVRWKGYVQAGVFTK